MSNFCSWIDEASPYEYVLYNQNVGEYLSIDETSLSQGELYTIVTNKEAKGKHGSLVSVVTKKFSGKDFYTPSLGDYPAIRGDQAIFFIMNDDLEKHTESKGVPLGVEILGMVYAYSSTDSALNNTIFLSYVLRNKSTTNYKDFYFGFWCDYDIGFAKDDYVGCDTLLNLGFGYNGKEIDGNGEC